MSKKIEIINKAAAVEYIKTLRAGSNAPISAILYSTINSLESQQKELMSNDDFYEDDGTMNPEIFSCLLDIRRNLTKCHIIKNGLSGYPLDKKIPVKGEKKFSSSAVSLVNMMLDEPQYKDYVIAESLIKKYPNMMFWSQICADNPALAIKSLDYFEEQNGAFFLKNCVKRYRELL